MLAIDRRALVVPAVADDDRPGPLRVLAGLRPHRRVARRSTRATHGRRGSPAVLSARSAAVHLRPRLPGPAAEAGAELWRSLCQDREPSR